MIFFQFCRVPDYRPVSFLSLSGNSNLGPATLLSSDLSSTNFPLIALRSFSVRSYRPRTAQYHRCCSQFYLRFCPNVSLETSHSSQPSWTCKPSKIWIPPHASWYYVSSTNVYNKFKMDHKDQNTCTNANVFSQFDPCQPTTTTCPPPPQHQLRTHQTWT